MLSVGYRLPYERPALSRISVTSLLLCNAFAVQILASDPSIIVLHRLACPALSDTIQTSCTSFVPNVSDMVKVYLITCASL